MGGKTPENLAFGETGPGEDNGVDDGGDGTGITDDGMICSRLNVTKDTAKKAIEYEDAITIPKVRYTVAPELRRNSKQR